MYHALIVAGESGTRLWPFSRRDHPKQMLSVDGKHTLFAHAVERLAPLFQPEQIFVVTRIEHVAALGTLNSRPVLSRVWSQVAKQTIDYGVMEKAQDVVVIPADIGWSDIGSWASLVDILGADAEGNTVVGPHLGVDTCDTLVMNQGAKRLVVTIGVEQMVVVSMDDVVMVCSKRQAQDVRTVVQRLEQKGWDDWL